MIVAAPAFPVLVTGATGAIGGAITRRLLTLGGGQVVVLVRGGKPLPEWLRGQPADRLRIVEGDLGNREAVGQAVQGVRTVFHAAAKVHSVAKTQADADAFFAVNLGGTENLLAALQGQPVQSLVFLSTIAVFGATREVLRESLPAEPSTPYAASKLEAERKVLAAGASQGYAATVLRLSMVYGEGDRGNFQRMLRSIARGRFVYLAGGHTKKSMTYVENVVDAVLLAASSPRAAGQVFVISDRQPYSLREVAVATAAAVGKKPPRLSIPAFAARGAAKSCELLAKPFGIKPPVTARDIDVLMSDVVCDTSRAEAELGFRARVGLEEGLRRTVGEKSLPATADKR